MHTIVLDDIGVEWDLDALAKRVRVGRESALREDLANLMFTAQAVARPKAIFRVGYIDAREDDAVVIDGVTFASRVLRVNLEEAHRVFPYVATCGRELHDWTLSLDDPLYRYWAEAIQVMALGAATTALNSHIAEGYQPGRTSVMSPGSLPDWPLPQQRPLFSLIGDVTAKIGVQLTESLLMIPAKSVSGIRFPTESSFESCQLCPRENCPGRRAPHDSALAGERYGLPAAKATHG